MRHSAMSSNWSETHCPTEKVRNPKGCVHSPWGTTTVSVQEESDSETTCAAVRTAPLESTMIAVPRARVRAEGLSVQSTGIAKRAG